MTNHTVYGDQDLRGDGSDGHAQKFWNYQIAVEMID